MIVTVRKHCLLILLEYHRREKASLTALIFSKSCKAVAGPPHVAVFVLCMSAGELLHPRRIIETYALNECSFAPLRLCALLRQMPWAGFCPTLMAKAKNK